jgi:Transglutaminase-like superfamily
MSTVPLRRIFTLLIVLSLLLGIYESVQQWRESRFVRVITEQVVSRVPHDRRSQVIAIRDYLRSHVTAVGAPYDNRPFLRASAAETLRSGKGYCGEVSRTFICMAGALGIPAQRINLYGRKQHVVAEAKVGPGDDYIVDSQMPPTIRDLERLDDVIRRPEFDDYYTLNLRRLRISWLVTRLRFRMGLFTYWTENPDALKALFFFLVAGILLALRAARSAVRRLITARGWVHVSSLDHVHSHEHFQRL